MHSILQFNSGGLPGHLEEQSTTDTATVQPQAVFIKSEYNGEEEDDEVIVIFSVFNYRQVLGKAFHVEIRILISLNGLEAGQT